MALNHITNMCTDMNLLPWKKRCGAVPCHFKWKVECIELCHHHGLKESIWPLWKKSNVEETFSSTSEEEMWHISLPLYMSSGMRLCPITNMLMYLYEFWGMQWISIPVLGCIINIFTEGNILYIPLKNLPQTQKEWYSTVACHFIFKVEWDCVLSPISW